MPIAFRLSPERLDPALLETRLEGFRLGNDLARLDSVARADAPEAVVFYASRILEALSGCAAERAAGELPATVFGSLVRLEECGFLSGPRLSCFHTLRLLGNEARHLKRSLQAVDAELGIALVERYLRWHFVESVLGPRLPALRAGPPETFATESSEALAAALSALEAPAQNAARLPSAFRDLPLLRETPWYAALAAEQLLGLGGEWLGPASALIDEALALHPGTLRLLQLHAHARRLRGDLDGAIAELEVLQQGGADDAETLGLLAGAYKRKWADATRWSGRERARHTLLQRCGDLYARAFKSSQGKSAYAGINAAALAQLRGAPETARAVADEVLRLFERRRGRFQPEGRLVFSGYWDHVTFAEALLLRGDADGARREYNSAFALHAGRDEWIRSTQTQLALLLPALGHDAAIESFLHPVRIRSSAMYTPRPIDTTQVELPESLSELAERLAENVHDRWAQRRMNEGWKHGPRRDDEKREHPDLIPYPDLPEGEKSYDRDSALETLKAILAMGFRIER